MIKLKAFSLALIAIMALSAALGSTAPAGQLDIGANPAVLTGHSEQITWFFYKKTDGTQLPPACNTSSFEGTAVLQQEGQSQTINEATLTPTFGTSQTTPNTGCSFGSPTHIQMNGCKYTFTGAGQAANTFNIDIFGCTAGKTMQIKWSECTMDIPEQFGLSHAVATNIANNEVTLDMTLSNITNTQTGAGCFDGNNHESTNLSLSVKTKIKAFKDKVSDQVTRHGHQYQEQTFGEQVSLLST